METAGVERVNRWWRGLLPAALGIIGLIAVISADFTGDHRVRAAGAAIVGAAILMAVAGWALGRPDASDQFDLRNWASDLPRSRDPGFLIVRPDQTELYECAVRAFGAARVVYDRRLEERRRGVLASMTERRQSEWRHGAAADFDIKAFGSAWVRL